MCPGLNIALNYNKDQSGLTGTGMEMRKDNGSTGGANDGCKRLLVCFRDFLDAAEMPQ